jgi:hypothetical protein
MRLKGSDPFNCYGVVKFLNWRIYCVGNGVQVYNKFLTGDLRWDDVGFFDIN